MKFSVLMSVYARERPSHFDAAIESVVNQSVPPEEFVVVEDGPLPDELREVAERWERKLGSDVFRRLPLPQNVGLPKALNEGLKLCRCEWVARMDTDDVSLPDRFEKQVTFLENHPQIRLLGGQVEEYSDDLVARLGARHVPLTHEEIVRFARTRNPFNHMTVMFHRESVLSVGGYPPELLKVQDFGLWAKMLVKGYRAANLSDVLAKVRAGNDIVRRRMGTEYFRYEWRLFNLMRQWGFLSTWDYFIAVGSRLVIRYLPQDAIEFVYSRVLQRGV